jgi:hypothetical protein
VDQKLGLSTAKSFQRHVSRDSLCEIWVCSHVGNEALRKPIHGLISDKIAQVVKTQQRFISSTARSDKTLDKVAVAGAYIGTEDEILLSGNLRELMHDIERIRTEARERNGWIMDTYLLRKTEKHEVAALVEGRSRSRARASRLTTC